jgi:hypothetical protein
MGKAGIDVYTVMAECGVGEFLWHRLSTDACLAGGNVFSQMDRAEDQDLISEGLFNKLFDWAGEYMGGQPDEWGKQWEVDWVVFNARGMELARLLKEELGATADVQYMRADQDPAGDEVLLYLGGNGS